jgi:hypothetical protein
MSYYMISDNVTQIVFGCIGILSFAYVAKITSDEIFREDIKVVESREIDTIPTATYVRGSISNLPTATPISGGKTKRKRNKNRKTKKLT